MRPRSFSELCQAFLIGVGLSGPICLVFNLEGPLSLIALSGLSPATGPFAKVAVAGFGVRDIKLSCEGKQGAVTQVFDSEFRAKLGSSQLRISALYLALLTGKDLLGPGKYASFMEYQLCPGGPLFVSMGCASERARIAYFPAPFEPPYEVRCAKP